MSTAGPEFGSLEKAINDFENFVNNQKAEESLGHLIDKQAEYIGQFRERINDLKVFQKRIDDCTSTWGKVDNARKICTTLELIKQHTIEITAEPILFKFYELSDDDTCHQEQAEVFKKRIQAIADCCAESNEMAYKMVIEIAKRADKVEVETPADESEATRVFIDNDSLHRIEDAILSRNGQAPEGEIVSSQATSGTIGNTDMIKHVDSAIAQLLGASLYQVDSNSKEGRKHNAKHVQKLLANTFVKQQINGRTKYQFKHRPNVSAASLETNQQQGKQQSLYKAFAANYLHVKTILQALDVVVCDCNEENFTFTRNETIADIQSLVNELNREGGPINGRVSSLNSALKRQYNIIKIGIGYHNDCAQFIQNVELAKIEAMHTDFELVMKFTQELVEACESVSDELPVGTSINQLLRAVKAVPASVSEVYQALSVAGVQKLDREARQHFRVLDWIKHTAESDWYLKLRDGDLRASEFEDLRYEINAMLDDCQCVKKTIFSLIPSGKRYVERALTELIAHLTLIKDIARDTQDDPGGFSYEKWSSAQFKTGRKDHV